MATVPTKPIEDKELFTDCYTMFYRHNTNMLQSKNFRCSGGLRKARERAQIHCDIMSYRLHFVQPMVSNLGLEEDYLLGKEKEQKELSA